MAALAKTSSPTQQLAKARAAAAMRKVTEAALTRRHTIALTVISAGVGFYEKGGKTLPSLIEGVPAKLQMAVLAALVADNTTGETAQYARALCDGMSAIVGYQFGKGETIGGDDLGAYTSLDALKASGAIGASDGLGDDDLGAVSPSDVVQIDI
jgi:hypothetical protein